MHYLPQPAIRKFPYFCRTKAALTMCAKHTQSEKSQNTLSTTACHPQISVFLYDKTALTVWTVLNFSESCFPEYVAEECLDCMHIISTTYTTVSVVLPVAQLRCVGVFFQSVYFTRHYTAIWCVCCYKRIIHVATILVKMPLDMRAHCYGIDVTWNTVWNAWWWHAIMVYYEGTSRGYIV